ncbi:cytochrome c oxidase cbb3-type, subunit I [Pseudomonas mandelii JR-1]|uniref:Cytochrome c oxidase cbb3-type, subunit I n=1 Tax=Pseudomonas mandelii JR-1 TaxID=1147786 RepID=A0A024E4J0_9PSED|nr:cytochrome c oxidase cbb3-type, subunit I [Pseudomonas mandelii JR-1]
MPGHPDWHVVHCRNPARNKTDSEKPSLCGSDTRPACGDLTHSDTVF